MFKLSLKNVWSRKGRLLLTALAIIAGTAFLSGVFVFTGTVKNSFDEMFANAYKNTDAVVRSSTVIEGEFGDDQRNRIDLSMVDRVAKLPGVAEVEGVIQSFAIIFANGKIIGQDGPPKVGANWSAASASPFAIVEGAPPKAGQVVVDRGSARSGPIKVGDTILVTTMAGPRPYQVSGIASFAGGDSALGTTWALFDMDTAQQVLTKTPGKIDYVAVRGTDTGDDTSLAASITAALSDPKLEVRTGSEMTKESQDSVARILNVITIAFSVFALISLFVGSFIIYNVFSISAAQRTRENALLRAVGASRSQVTRSMFIEALVVGLGGSLIGCVAGLGLAALILKIMQGANMLSKDTSLFIEPRGFIITVIVGVLVTLVCAIAPALRSGRVPPLAAMRDVAIDNSDVSRRRLVFGALIVAGAVASTMAGLGGNTQLLGLGAGLLFTSVIVLGPLFAGPFIRWVGPALSKVRPGAGTIAVRNAGRNPKRTALTAGALAIVVALFIGVATLGSSAKATARHELGDAFASDYVVQPKVDAGGFGLPPTLSAELAALPNTVVLPVAQTRVTINPGENAKSRSSLVVDGPASAVVVENLKFVAGSFDGLNKDTILLSVKEAASANLGLGGTVTVALKDGVPHELRVAGIYDSNFLGRRMLSRDLFQGANADDLTDFSIFIKSDGTSADQLRKVVDGYPSAKLQSRDEYLADQANQVDSFLNLIYGLLAMSMFIAIVGIVITLLLAVYERRRELGLVRAVGMTRRQVRSSVTGESLLTALLGTALGVVLGVALGWIVVRALRDQGLSVFELPVPTIIAAVVGAVALAALAAFLPARRAAKADILEAIATT